LPERVPDSRVKIVARLFDLVALTTRIGALESVCRVDIEEKREVGNEAGGGQPIGSAYLLLGQSTANDLVRVCGQEEPVDQNDISLPEGRQDLTRDQLGAGRNEQERFSRSSDLLLSMKHDVSDVVADRSATGLAYRDEWYPGCRQALRQNPDLGRLARAFSPFEDDQTSARHCQDRVMIGLAAPFFMPSMIH
jgi:hypothetical protein